MLVLHLETHHNYRSNSPVPIPKRYHAYRTVRTCSVHMILPELLPINTQTSRSSSHDLLLFGLQSCTVSAFLPVPRTPTLPRLIADTVFPFSPRATLHIPECPPNSYGLPVVGLGPIAHRMDPCCSPRPTCMLPIAQTSLRKSLLRRALES